MSEQKIFYCGIGISNYCVSCGKPYCIRNCPHKVDITHLVELGFVSKYRGCIYS